jgi:hypothetical protein
MLLTILRDEPELSGEIDNASSLIEQHRAWKYHDGIASLCGYRREFLIQLIGTFHSNKSKVQP